MKPIDEIPPSWAGVWFMLRESVGLRFLNAALWALPLTTAKVELLRAVIRFVERCIENGCEKCESDGAEIERDEKEAEKSL